MMFSQVGQGKQDIIVAGERALVSLYGGAKDGGLDILQYNTGVYTKHISKGTRHVEPRTLPPTSAAEMYHSVRVYYHIMYWKGKSTNMKQREWGLYILNGKYMPMQTDKPAEPTERQDIISCITLKETVQNNSCY